MLKLYDTNNSCLVSSVLGKYTNLQSIVIKSLLYWTIWKEEQCLKLFGRRLRRDCETLLWRGHFYCAVTHAADDTPVTM